MRSKYSVGLNVHQVFYSCPLATLVHFPYTEMIAIFEWLCGVVVSAMDLRSAACRFDSQPLRFRAAQRQVVRTRASIAKQYNYWRKSSDTLRLER